MAKSEFEADVEAVFDEFRELINKLEAKVKQREEQIKREVKAEILSNLESIYEDFFSERLETIARKQTKQKDSFLQVLKAKLDKDEIPDVKTTIVNHAITSKPKTSSLSSAFQVVAKSVETSSISPKVITINSSILDVTKQEASDDCQTPDKVDKSDSVTRIVVPLNPTQFMDGPYKSDDELTNPEDTSPPIVPPVYYRPTVKKRSRVYHLPVTIVNNSNQCPICFQNFSQRNSLNRHIRSHTGERPFPCNYCGKSFIDKERLKVHIRIHTGEKPFSCDICGRHFTQKSTVKRHMSVHTGEKPFQCVECGKGFGSKDNLKVHIKSHNRFLHILGVTNELTNESQCLSV